MNTNNLVPRQIAVRSAGRRHGPITRLVSPSDIGELIKPFVFLDYVDAPGGGGPNFGFHPHSGIATLTFPLTFDIEHQTSTGQVDVVHRGGVEWVVAGAGIWHKARPASTDGDRLQAFQLWFALPPSHEAAPPSTLFIQPNQVPTDGPVTVLAGTYGAATSAVPVPFDANYLWVQLKDGQAWNYEPPAMHEVAWAFAQSGTLEVNGETLSGELAVFEDGAGRLAFRPRGDCAFLLGSAAKRTHDLVLGPYSVHSNPAALAAGTKRISEIGEQLQRDGLI